MNARIQDVQVRDFGVVVGFDNQNRLTFVENTGGWGGAANLMRVFLEYKDEVVVDYISPHQYPVNRRDFGLKVHKEGYREKFIEYWEMARKYINNGRASSEDLTLAWLTIILGSRDLEDIKAGD